MKWNRYSQAWIPTSSHTNIIPTHLRRSKIEPWHLWYRSTRCSRILNRLVWINVHLNCSDEECSGENKRDLVVHLPTSPGGSPLHGRRHDGRSAKFRHNVARFRLYRHRSLQVNMRFSWFFEIYKIINLQFWKFSNVFISFCKICKILPNFKNFSLKIW